MASSFTRTFSSVTFIDRDGRKTELHGGGILTEPLVQVPTTPNSNTIWPTDAVSWTIQIAPGNPAPSELRRWAKQRYGWSNRTYRRMPLSQVRKLWR